MSEVDPLTASLVLLERYQGGDEAALNKLMTRYYPRVERIVRARMGGFLRSRMEVEDVLQQVFVRAMRDMGGLELREDAALIHWLARLVENELANLARNQKAIKRDARREHALEQLAEVRARLGLRQAAGVDHAREELAPMRLPGRDRPYGQQDSR